MKYEINAGRVLDHLKSHGVEHLYHANTVRTSCTFLREGALLSRGTLDELGLDQTSQYTDDDDIEFGLWYDVFLDTVDINVELDRRNKYGPVLFVFDVELLAEDWLQLVWITESNPANWKDNDTPYQDRYFHSDELNRYDPLSMGSFGNHIVLRNAGGVLRLQPHLQRVIVDDPFEVWPPSKSLRNPFDLFSMAVGALVNAGRSSGIILSSDVKLKPRECEDKYQGVSDDDIQKIFSP